MTHTMSTPRACFVPKQLNVTPNREVHRATQLRDFVRKITWETSQYPIVSQLVHGRTTTQRDQETTFSFAWKWKDQHSNVFCLLISSVLCETSQITEGENTVDFLCTARVSGTRLALSAWKRASFLTCAAATKLCPSRRAHSVYNTDLSNAADWYRR